MPNNLFAMSSKEKLDGFSNGRDWDGQGRAMEYCLVSLVLNLQQIVREKGKLQIDHLSSYSFIFFLPDDGLPKWLEIDHSIF